MLLLADLLEALLPLIVAVGWGLLQLFSALQGNDNKQKQAAEKRRARAIGQGDAADQAAQKQADLRSEVDDFLRRLKNPNAEPEKAAPPQPAQDPAEQQRPPRRKPPRRPRVEVLVDEAPTPAPTDTPRRLVPAIDAPKPERETTKRRPVIRATADQAERLREQAARSEARIHEKFDHEVGSLAAKSTEAAEHAYDEPAYATSTDKSKTQPAAAQQIADMLRDPSNVRNAVILNEILTRKS